MRVRHLVALLVIAAVLVPAASFADTGFTAVINAANEVPTNASPATGLGTCVLNNAQTQLTYTVVYSGLVASRTASHFHGPAAVGINAPVIFGIAGAGATSGTISGVWNLSATNVTQLFAGQLYLNIHSSTFPGGEIRGQVILDTTPTHNTSWGRIKRLYSQDSR
jgi:hypothetical protein